MTWNETLSALCLASATLAAPPALAAPDGPTLVHFDPAALDRQIDPCADFHAHVCSKWMAANPIPADQAVWGTGSSLQIWNETVLRKTMEQASAPDPKRSAVQQRIGDYWHACMDEEGLARRGLAPVERDLDRIAALGRKAGLAREIAALHRDVPGAWQMDDNQTHAPMFGYGSIQDFADCSLVVASVDQGGMGLPGRDYYLADDVRMKEVRQKYREHVRRMLALSGWKPDRAAAGADVVLGMETALAKAAMDAVTRRDPKAIYNVRTREQLEAAAPRFDWKGYLEAIASPAPRHYVVTAPEFFAGLGRLIASESLDHWKTYLRWWALHGNARYLGKAFEEEHFDFYGRTLTGAQVLRPRWRRCVAWADRDLGEALGQAYVERAFPPESKRRAEGMVKALERALSADLRELDWMDAATRREAAAKLEAIEDKIGYPKAWRDYGPLAIGRDSLAGNVHAATAFELRRQLAKIGRPVDRAEWQMTPPTINAQYDAQLNTINFPAGILQPPYYEATLDDSVNYGAIGMVIGHEIIHGFDDEGRKFDAKGNLRDWWTPEDARKYEERGRCIAEQYTGDVPDLGVRRNGLLTQGEDTADNGGLRIALMALEDEMHRQGRPLDDPGPDGLTARQRFFAAFAFSWCDNVRPEVARMIVATNPHSLPRFRVNDVVANMPEFQKAFACKKGQPMVRERPCRLW